MTNSNGLKRELNMSFLPPAWLGGGTGNTWVESKIDDALISFSAKLSQASRKSEVTA